MPPATDAPATELSRRNRFTGLALDRRDEWRADAERIRALWRDARVVVVDFEGHAPGRETRLDAIAASTLDESAFAHASFLGTQDELPWFALPASVWDETLRPADAAWIGLRAGAWGRGDAGAAAAERVAGWYGDAAD